MKYLGPLILFALVACGGGDAEVERQNLEVDGGDRDDPSSIGGFSAANPPPTVVPVGSEDPVFAGSQLVAEVETFQTAVPGSLVNAAPALQVLDSDGRPVVGAPVQFEAVGGGAIDQTEVFTDERGFAFLGEWRVGNSVGNYAVDALFAGGVLRFVAEATSRFSIQLDFRTEVSSSMRTAFQRAADRWAGVIRGDLDNLSFDASDLPENCGFDENDGTLSVDDLLIAVTVELIDGEAGVLGRAGPCVLRRDGGAPLVGQMVFDNADLEALEEIDRLESVILHEMGHVLGIGTLWVDLLQSPSLVNGEGSNTRFIGERASLAYESLGGGSAENGVPVENDGRPGSADGHWREVTFRNELMSPSLGIDDPSLPLSIVTAASLEDLGVYEVNTLATDVFEFPSAASLLLEPRFERTLELNDLPILPTHEMDRAGRLYER